MQATMYEVKMKGSGLVFDFEYRGNDCMIKYFFCTIIYMHGNANMLCSCVMVD